MSRRTRTARRTSYCECSSTSGNSIMCWNTRRRSQNFVKHCSMNVGTRTHSQRKVDSRTTLVEYSYAFVEHSQNCVIIRTHSYSIRTVRRAFVHVRRALVQLVQHSYTFIQQFYCTKYWEFEVLRAIHMFVASGDGFKSPGLHRGTFRKQRTAE